MRPRHNWIDGGTFFMKMFARIRTAALGAALVVLSASLAQAQATRTWVSGVGDDANPCSRTAPCKTFAGTISKTATGGYINAVDSGGFGAVTVTKSITIDGEGVQAGILAASVKGVIVNAATAVVHLRNLSIEGVVLPGVGQGIDGVEVIAAARVHVENCRINGFTNSAINFHPSNAQLFVINSRISANTNNGIIVATGRATIDNTQITGNPSAIAVNVNGNAIATVRKSLISGNSTGLAAITNPAAVLNIEDCVVTHNFNGITVNSGTTARVSNTTVVSNTSNGMVNDGISFIVSLSGNMVFGNPTNGSFTSTQFKQ